MAREVEKGPQHLHVQSVLLSPFYYAERLMFEVWSVGVLSRSSVRSHFIPTLRDGVRRVQYNCQLARHSHFFSSHWLEITLFSSLDSSLLSWSLLKWKLLRISIIVIVSVVTVTVRVRVLDKYVNRILFFSLPESAQQFNELNSSDFLRKLISPQGSASVRKILCYMIQSEVFVQSHETTFSSSFW